MARFHHWAYLNEEGKELFGQVFPDGEVPVISMIASGATIGGKPQAIFKVDVKQLSEEQLDTLLEVLSRKFGAPKKLIRKQFEKDGFIPLRASLTNGSGTDHPGFFF